MGLQTGGRPNILKCCKKIYSSQQRAPTKAHCWTIRLSRGQLCYDDCLKKRFEPIRGHHCSFSISNNSSLCNQPQHHQQQKNHGDRQHFQIMLDLWLLYPRKWPYWYGLPTSSYRSHQDINSGQHARWQCLHSPPFTGTPSQARVERILTTKIGARRNACN